MEENLNPGRREEILGRIFLELAQSGFAVERYEDSSGEGIRGNLADYPMVLVNVYIHRNIGEIQACVYFERDAQLNMVTAVNPEFRDKTRERRYAFSADLAEIAQELHQDALALGTALDVIMERQEIEAGMRQS